MWQVYRNTTYVSVIDSSGQLVAMYDILSGPPYYADNPYALVPTSHIAVDASNNVVVSDLVDESVLFVSLSGDVTHTVSSPVATVFYASQLLADYASGGGGGGAGSLLFSDAWSSYTVQRMSTIESDFGALLQRYSLPARLHGQCNATNLDVGSHSGYFYLLLTCSDAQSQYWLVYITTPFGRIVSEFRLVESGAQLVRVDEGAGIFYVYAAWWVDSKVYAHSAINGSLLAAYSTSDAALGPADFTLLMPTGVRQGSTTIVTADASNNRLVFFSSRNSTNYTLAAWPTQIFYNNLAYSLLPQPSFYASGYTVVNDSYFVAFIHRFDISDPNNLQLTDVYLPPPGMESILGPIVIGLDRHLYAFEYNSKSVYQWRQADQPPSSAASIEQQQTEEDEPRVHIGRVVVGSGKDVDAEASKLTAMPRPYAQNRHSRTRGASLD